MDQLNATLPFFPLSVFLFPGEDIPLHIFEPRYKQLIDEARTLEISFAIFLALSFGDGWAERLMVNNKAINVKRYFIFD